MISGRQILTLLVVFAVATASVVLGSPIQSTARDGTSPVLVMQTGHAGFIRCLDVSPDGQLAVTGSDDSSIRIWSVSSGEELRHISQGAAVHAVAFSPDGQTIAAMSYENVTAWDVASGALLKSWSYFASNPYAQSRVTFSRDGKDIIAADLGRIFVWNVASGKLRHLENIVFGCFAAKPGTAVIALCQNDRVVLWNSNTWTIDKTLGPPSSTFEISAEIREGYRQALPQLRKLVPSFPDELNPAMVMKVEISRDQRTVITNHMDGSLRVWDAASGIQKAVSKSGMIDDIAIDPNGDSFAVAFGDKITLRSVASAEIQSELTPPKAIHAGTMPAMFARNYGALGPLRYIPHTNKIIQALTAENRLVFWDLPSQTSLRPTPTSLGIPAAFLSSDGRHLYTITGDAPKSWDLKNAHGTNFTSEGTPSGVSLSADGKWVVWNAYPNFEFLSTDPLSQTRYVLPQCHDDISLVTCGKMNDGLEDVFGFTADDASFFIRETESVMGAISSGTPTAFYEATIEGHSIRKLFELPSGGPVVSSARPARNIIAWADSPPIMPTAASKPSDVRHLRLYDWSRSRELDSLNFPTASDAQVVEMVSQIHEENPEGFGDLVKTRIAMEGGLRNGERVSKIAFNRDCNFAAAAYQFHGVTLWSIPDRKVRFQSGPHVQPNGRPGRMPNALGFSSDSRWLASGWNDGTISLIDTNSGIEDYAWKGHDDVINSVSFSPDSKLLISASQDGTVKFWSLGDRTLQMTMSPGLTSSDWATVAPSGFFDGGADGWARFLWRFPSSILDALPIEVYFREYFRPGLLARVFQCNTGNVEQCEALSATQPLASLNRSQPIVEIRSIEPAPDSLSLVSAIVNLTAPVSAGRKRGSAAEGVYDLRLFRDGQMVARWPEPAVAEKTGPIVSDRDREVWRRQHQVRLDANGKATITFHNIRVPVTEGLGKVEFTAYAFNSDRVKSLTTRPYEYQLPQPTAANAISRKAFLITVGVNASQSHNLDLELAVSSAERARVLLRTKLLQDYHEVAEIPLYSDLEPDSNQTRLKAASKANLRAVLSLLAGRSIDPALRNEVDPQHQLRAAGPDDAVVLYVASHGYADPQGVFYLMPYDTGPNWGITEDVLTRCQTKPDQSPTCKQAQDLLMHSVSSSDLTAWWNGVDAGEMVMILDSCHSGAVPGKEFRPAPLGDPGFGQLSYDKGMVILSASQPAQTERGEWVTGGEGRTLLIDALETAAQANAEQSLRQWLQQTELQLPTLAKQLYPTLKDEDVQIPLLLDFARTPTNAGLP
jgi:WD40 repeat protein